MTNNEIQKFNEGVKHGKAIVLNDMLEESDKLHFFACLYRKGCQEINKEIEPIKKAMLEGYTEGIRHCLNVLETLGESQGAYDSIISPKLKLNLTKDGCAWAMLLRTLKCV